MEQIQLPAETTAVRTLRADRDEAPGFARDRAVVCSVIGDPSGFVVSLERELGRMRRYCDSSCLLMIAADAQVDMMALDRLGQRFAANLRSYDSLCRYGANHFLVLLPHVKPNDVAGIVRRLRVQAVGYALKLADGSEGFVTATVGGTMLDTDCGMHGNIDRAALAYKTARRDGGNDLRMWAPALEAV